MHWEIPDYFPQATKRSACVLFAKALCQTWPGLVPIWGEVTDRGFYFDFHLSHSPTADFGERSVENFDALAKKKIAFRPLSRLRENAAQWFALKGQVLRADIIAQMDRSSIGLAAVDDFLEPCMGSLAPQLPPLELLLNQPIPVTYLQKGKKRATWRIQAALFSSSQSKSRFATRKRRVLQNGRDHLQLGEQLGYFKQIDSNFVWQQKGVLIKHQLQRWWRAFQIQGGIKLFEPFILNYLEKHTTDLNLKRFNSLIFESASGEKKTERLTNWQIIKSNLNQAQSEGLLAQEVFQRDFTEIFCEKEQLLLEFTSALRRVEWVSDLFDLRGVWEIQIPAQLKSIKKNDLKNWLKQAFENLNSSTFFYQGESRQFVVANHLVKCSFGTWWPTGSVSLKLQSPRMSGFKESRSIENELPHISYSLFGNFERFIALIIEEKKGELPPWLTSTHLLIYTDCDHQDLIELMNNLRNRAIDFQICKIQSAQMTRVIDSALKRKIGCFITATKIKPLGFSAKLYSAKGEITDLDVEKFADSINADYAAALGSQNLKIEESI